MLVDDRRLRTRATQGGTGCEDELEVLVRLLVPGNPLGSLKKPPELDQGGHAGADRRLESLFADPTETEGAEPCLVGDADQVIAFGESANGTALAVSEAASGTLRPQVSGAESPMEPKVASPAGGVNVPRVRARAGSRENRSWSSSHLPSYSKRMVSAPRTRLLRTSPTGRVAAQIDMHLEVSHHGKLQPTA